MPRKTKPVIKSTGIAVLTSFFMGLGSAGAIAYTSNLYPTHREARSYTTKIKTIGSLKGVDETDIYFPVTENETATFPVALMLQGALVDKADYSNFATLVARYGFIVAVPNHLREVVGPNGPVTGQFPDVNLVRDVLAFIQSENINEESPLYRRVDADRMGLVGHSLGGFVGLSAIQGFASLSSLQRFFQTTPRANGGNILRNQR